MNVPAPAVAGLNMPPLTPVPLYVPPTGNPPVKVNELALIHTLGNVANVTVGNGFTVIDDVALDVHPLPLVNV